MATINPRTFPKQVMALTAPFLAGARAKFVVFSPMARQYSRFDAIDIHSCVDAYLAFKKSRFDDIGRVPDFQEVVEGTTWHRIMFDLDFCVDPEDDAARDPTAYKHAVAWFRDAIKELIYAASDAFLALFHDVITESDFIVCESMDPREPLKLSAHVIIAREVPNHRAAARITDLTIAAMPDDMREIVDRGLNSSTHNLRLAGCAKQGSVRIKHVPEGFEFIDTVVCAPAQRVSAESAEQWLTPCVPKCNVGQVEVPSRYVARAIELINAKYGAGTHVVRSNGAIGSLILFRRCAPSYCEICQRTHDHDNTVIVQVSATSNGTTKLRELCRHAIAKDSDAREPSAALCEPAAALREPAAALREPIILDTIADDGIDEALAQATGAAAPVAATARDTWESRIMTKRYEADAMRDYPPESRTLFVRAPMKLGKTKALRRFIDAHVAQDDARIVFVSFRRTFSASVSRSFAEFSLYTTIQGPLDAPKMIVQVESLHRIIPEQLGIIDLLILDESESILDQFDSGLSQQHRNDFAVFQWLVRTAKRCIALDAFMSERTYAVIARMRGIEGAQIIRNEYRNAARDTYFFAANRDQWLIALRECIAKGERIVICANSATEGRTLNELLVRADITQRVKFYCAETPTNIKERDFANVDSAWADCEVLIYTPTITAGVSFEREHFDKMFGYFTDKSCSAQVCLQMMGRIRNIASHQNFICLQTTPGSFPTTREEMILALRIRKWAILSTELPEIEYTSEGLPTIPDTDYAELRVQNMIARNRSRNSFAKELIAMIAEPGAKCVRLTNEIHSKVFGSMPCAEDIAEAHNEHAEARNDVSQRRAEAIANAREMTGGEYDRVSSSETITDEDRAALRKFELRMTYRKFEGNIEPGFVMNFLDPQVASAFRNLEALCGACARNDRDVSRALVEMRAIESAHCRSIVGAQTSIQGAESSAADDAIREFDFSYTYNTHRLAHSVARILGFESVLDRRLRATRDIDNCVMVAAARCAAIWPEIKSQFKLPPAKSGSQSFVAAARIIFKETYGIILVRTGELSQLDVWPLFRILPNGILTTVS